MSHSFRDHRPPSDLQSWLPKAEPTSHAPTGGAATFSGATTGLATTPVESSAVQGTTNGGPSPFGFMAEGATAGLGAVGGAAGVSAAAAAAIAGAASAVAPKKEYVDMNAQGKTDALVGLMDGSRDVLSQNGVSQHGEELLAGIMRNEGGRNERRGSMGREFNKDAAALNKLDLGHLTDKQTKRLSSDQKALLELSQQGKLDLKDSEAVKNAGIDIRTNQYNRMQELSKNPDPLSKADKAELAGLKKVHVVGGGTLSDYRGLSGDRFHEIFDEGQTRFELGQYKQFRTSYENQHGKPKKPGEDMTLHAGIGNATLDASHQAQLNTNYDMLADYSTSYGTAQIMGLYAGQGQLKSKNGQGEDHSYGLDELKGSARRFTPNSEDVGMQLAFMNMKGIDMSHPPDATSLAQKYNGKGPNAAPYARRMLAGAADYHTARAAHDKDQAGPTH